MFRHEALETAAMHTHTRAYMFNDYLKWCGNVLNILATTGTQHTHVNQLNFPPKSSSIWICGKTTSLDFRVKNVEMPTGYICVKWTLIYFCAFIVYCRHSFTTHIQLCHTTRVCHSLDAYFWTDCLFIGGSLIWSLSYFVWIKWGIASMFLCVTWYGKTIHLESNKSSFSLQLSFTHFNPLTPCVAGWPDIE